MISEGSELCDDVEGHLPLALSSYEYAEWPAAAVVRAAAEEAELQSRACPA